MLNVQDFEMVQRLAQDVAHESFDESAAPLAELLAFASDELSNAERLRLSHQLRRIGLMPAALRAELLDEIGWVWEADSEIETSRLFLDLADLFEGAEELLSDQ